MENPMALMDDWKGSIDEMRKATWPGKDEVVRVTIVVMIFTAIFASVLFLIDFAARLILQGILR